MNLKLNTYNYILSIYTDKKNIKIIYTNALKIHVITFPIWKIEAVEHSKVKSIKYSFTVNKVYIALKLKLIRLSL